MREARGDEERFRARDVGAPAAEIGEQEVQGRARPPRRLDEDRPAAQSRLLLGLPGQFLIPLAAHRLVQLNRLFRDIESQGVRRLRVGQRSVNLEDTRVARHLHLEHGFFQPVDRRGIPAQPKALDSFQKQIVTGGEQFVATQRFEVDRTHRSRNARIAAGGRIDHDARNSRIFLGQNQTGAQGQSYRNAAGDCDAAAR